MEQFISETKTKSGANRPDDINLLKMIESRITEIIKIEDECKRKLPQLFNQRLPRFMRRRAASHNPKRIPRKIRLIKQSDYGTKSRKKLLKYRLKVRRRKHKRVLKKHPPKLKDPNKGLLHKWFAKRFKIGAEEPLLNIPLHNNTKNQRNLARQSKFGCAYLSLAHLVPIQLILSPSKHVCSLNKQIDSLNLLANEISGFTFSARALEKGHFEVAIHFYKPNSDPREYICPALVSLVKAPIRNEEATRLTMWIPRSKIEEVFQHLQVISSQCDDKFDVLRLKPKDITRIRLVGPSSHDVATGIALTKSKHESAIKDSTVKLDASFGLTIGRHLEDKVASFTYYNTYPSIVDVIFKGSQGKMLWYKLIKNKAHLVGGYRDIERVLPGDRFNLSPDY